MFPFNPQADSFEHARQRMVDRQLRGRQITNAAVLEAFERVPRHEFVPENLRDHAYEDRPLDIGHGQTISQPFVVAYMIELAQVEAGSRVLDIGGGSGYQAAILASMGCQVVSVEIVPELARAEQQRLAELGYDRVTAIGADCQEVVRQHLPFQAMIAAAAPPEVPHALVEHLTPGGRLVIPVGTQEQRLLVIEKQSDGTIKETSHGSVRFVPLTGANGYNA